MVGAPVGQFVRIADLKQRPEVYSFSWPSGEEEHRLRRSLEEFGLLHPLIAVPTPDGLLLVAGRRRARVLGESGVDHAAVRVVEPGEPAALWDLLLEEHRLARPLNPVEVGRYVRARMGATGEDAEEIARSVLPRLGLPARVGVLEDYAWVAELPPTLRTAFADGRLPLQGVRVLARAPRDDALAVLALLSQGRLGTNRFSELARWVLECAGAAGVSAADWIREQGVDAFAGEPDALRREVRRRRYPRVTAREASFGRDLRSLRLPGNVHVAHPPWFEGGRLSCQIGFGSVRELEAAVASLAEAAAEGRFQALGRYLG